MKLKRLEPDARRCSILTAALDLSELRGYQNITREEIAKRACISPGLINHYFDTMETVRRAIMLTAIKLERLNIVAQGLSLNDPYAHIAPDVLKARAAATLIDGGADVQA